MRAQLRLAVSKETACPPNSHVSHTQAQLCPSTHPRGRPRATMPRAESMPNEPLIGRESQASSLRLSAVTFDAPFASGLRSGGVGGRPGLSFRQETGRTCLISVLCTLLLLYMMPVDEDESLGMNNNGEPALYGVTCTPTKAAACPAAVFSVLLCCVQRGQSEGRPRWRSAATA